MTTLEVVINMVGAVFTGVMAVHCLKANKPRLAAAYGTFWLTLVAITVAVQILLWTE
jgi:succinate-acetate transporter protein